MSIFALVEGEPNNYLIQTAKKVTKSEDYSQTSCASSNLDINTCKISKRCFKIVGDVTFTR